MGTPAHMKIDFDAETHTYKVNRVVYPSVTQILSDEGWSDYSFLAYRPARDPCFENRGEELSYRGHWVHAACALLLQGRLRWDSLHSAPAWAGFVLSCQLAVDRNGITPLLIEQIFFNPEDGYCGTIDLLCVIEDWLVVLDLKTGEKERWHRLQTALYRRGVLYLPVEVYPWRGEAHRRATLHLKEDGSPGRLEWMDDVRDYEWARAVVKSWYARKELYGDGR